MRASIFSLAPPFLLVASSESTGKESSNSYFCSDSLGSCLPSRGSCSWPSPSTCSRLRTVTIRHNKFRVLILATFCVIFILLLVSCFFNSQKTVIFQSTVSAKKFHCSRGEKRWCVKWGGVGWGAF